MKRTINFAPDPKDQGGNPPPGSKSSKATTTKKTPKAKETKPKKEK